MSIGNVATLVEEDITLCDAVAGADWVVREGGTVTLTRDLRWK